MKNSFPIIGSSPIELTPPDRRREVRHAVRVPMHIFRVNQLSADYPALCTDISRGGLGFNSATRLELGAIIEFEFAFCGDHPFRHSARILYRVGNHYGAYSLDGDEDAWDDAQDQEIAKPRKKKAVH